MRVCPQCGYRATAGRRLGERSPQAKLTNEQAMSIFKSPLPSKELAEIYKVGVEAVQRIKNGRKWSSVTGAVYRPRKLKS